MVTGMEYQKDQTKTKIGTVVSKNDVNYGTNQDGNRLDDSNH